MYIDKILNEFNMETTRKVLDARKGLNQDSSVLTRDSSVLTLGEITRIF